MGKQLLWNGQEYKKKEMINAPIKTTRKLIAWGSLLILPFFTYGMSLVVWMFLYGFGNAGSDPGCAWRFITGSDELKFKLKINEGYYLSMKEAMVTPYPHGIVYILENTLKHLDNFSIQALPVKNEFQSIEFGWPNQTTLREAIDLAKYTMNKWDSLELAERTGTMATIRQLIKSEVMNLGGSVYQGPYGGSPSYFPNIDINKNHYYIDIYKYYYNDEAYQRDRGNNSPQSELQKTSFPTTYPQPQSNSQAPKRILTFEEYRQQNPSLLYLSEPEQREEYHNYLASMEVQPPSSTTRPYYSDNSSYRTDNKEDDSVW